MENYKKKTRLRAINNGTRYDVVGKLKQLARQIEHGEYGDVRNAVIGIEALAPMGKTLGKTFHFGTGTIANCMSIIETMKKDIT